MTERTAEEWGRVAMGLLGWTWTMPWCLLPDKWGRVYRRNWCPQDTGFGFTQVFGPSLRQRRSSADAVINPDDPATTGCLESLLGDEAWRVRFLGATAGAWCWEVITDPMDPPASGQVFAPDEKGRACIAAAEMLERWPGST